MIVRFAYIIQMDFTLALEADRTHNRLRIRLGQINVLHRKGKLLVDASLAAPARTERALPHVLRVLRFADLALLQVFRLLALRVVEHVGLTERKDGVELRELNLAPIQLRDVDRGRSVKLLVFHFLSHRLDGALADSAHGASDY